MNARLQAWGTAPTQSCLHQQALHPPVGAAFAAHSAQLAAPCVRTMFWNIVTSKAPAMVMQQSTAPTCWVSLPQPVVLDELLQAHDVSLELHL